MGPLVLTEPGVGPPTAASPRTGEGAPHPCRSQAQSGSHSPGGGVGVGVLKPARAAERSKGPPSSLKGQLPFTLLASKELAWYPESVFQKRCRAAWR